MANQMKLLVTSNPPWPATSRAGTLKGQLKALSVFPPKVHNFNECVKLLRALCYLRNKAFKRHESEARTKALKNADIIYWYLVSLYPQVELCLENNIYWSSRHPASYTKELEITHIDKLRDAVRRHIGYRNERIIGGQLRVDRLNECIENCNRAKKMIGRRQSLHYNVVMGTIYTIEQEIDDELKLLTEQL